MSLVVVAFLRLAKCWVCIVFLGEDRKRWEIMRKQYFAFG